ncbi:unnamed protein product [Oncorhynchus mykiss]|uniref:Uncharacterized protein n=1 Tax=Oncorhynchus mykiss TaxID=8022 RepID=A0A060XFC3_ONCMY|nr:unnamed protein product [Oncorhynchus mykiss]
MPQLYAEIFRSFEGQAQIHHRPILKLEGHNSFYALLEICALLEIYAGHSFHLLVNGHPTVASWITSSGVGGVKKSTVSSTDEYDGVNQEMHSYFRQASVNRKDIIKLPGVWDPFVLSYINMLEFYNDHEGTVKVLNDYAYDISLPPQCPCLPLPKCNHPSNKLLSAQDPAYIGPKSRVNAGIQFSSATVRESDLQKALGVVLDLLDLSSWRRNLDVWNHLMTIVKRLRPRKQWLKIVAEELVNRMDWWLAMHFTTFLARRDLAMNGVLLEVKCFVLGAFCPRCKYSYTVTLLLLWRITFFQLCEIETSSLIGSLVTMWPNIQLV